MKKRNIRIATLACAAVMSMSTTSLCLSTEALGNQTLTTAASTAITSVVELTSSFSSKTASFKSDYTSTTTAIRLNWNKVSGASGYRIYKYDSSAKKWVKVKTVKSGSTTTARITGLSAGSKYRFKVKAYKHYNGKTVWSKASSAKYAATKPKQVTMKSASASQNSIRLNWKKVKCDGYKIYQKVGKTYKLIATIKNSDTTTYKVTGRELLSESDLNYNSYYEYDETTNEFVTKYESDSWTSYLASGTKYTFKVRAYKKDTAGKVVYGKCGVKTKTTKYDSDNKFDMYIKNNITSSMSTYEKLCKLCEYPCSYDYGKWNCATGGLAVIDMAKKLGFSATLIANSDYSHYEAMVYANGCFYDCNVGYYGTAPREYSVTKETKAIFDDTDYTNSFWTHKTEYLGTTPSDLFYKKYDEMTIELISEMQK